MLEDILPRLLPHSPALRLRSPQEHPSPPASLLRETGINQTPRADGAIKPELCRGFASSFLPRLQQTPSFNSLAEHIPLLGSIPAPWAGAGLGWRGDGTFQQINGVLSPVVQPRMTPVGTAARAHPSPSFITWESQLLMNGQQLVWEG